MAAPAPAPQPDGAASSTDVAVCAICLEDATCDTLALPCAHVYHRRCICRWLEVAPRCPQCGQTTAAAFRRPPSSTLVAASWPEAGLSERMTEAEVQLRAAQRIMASNERHLRSLSTRFRHSAPHAASEGMRLRQRLDDAEAAARAAGAQLRLLEAELLGDASPVAHARHRGRRPRSATTTARAATSGSTGAAPPPRVSSPALASPWPAWAATAAPSPLDLNRHHHHHHRRAPSPRAAAGVARSARAAAAHGLLQAQLMTPMRRRLERNAEQMVRSQIRAAQRQPQVIVRPSRRGAVSGGSGGGGGGGGGGLSATARGGAAAAPLSPPPPPPPSSPPLLRRPSWM